MASTRRKSAAIALAVIGVAGLSLAAAATLDVNGGDIQAGVTVDATCDTDGVNVGYTTGYASGVYGVTQVVVKGVAAACAGNSVGISVPGGTPVTPVEQPVVSTTADYTFAVAIPAATLSSVAVIIHS